VSLLGVEVDGRSYPPDQPLELGHRQNRVSFRLAAVSFRDEGRIEYRTWLRGLDAGWVVETGPARLESRYSALPPGTYVFAGQARTENSGWSKVVATAPVTIGRPFWLQAWFLACVALVLVALGISGHRFHAQRRYARKLEREVTLRTAELAASRSSIEAEHERLERTVESVADGLAATGSDRRVVLWNRSAEQITGRSAAEAIGRPLEEVLPLAAESMSAPEDRADGLVDVLEAILEGGEQPRVPGVYRLAGRSGEPRILELTGAPTGGAGGSRGAVVAFRDVTGRRRFEQELVKAQKLESLGVLAGGIAHDFNNLLTVILGYLSLVQASPRLSGRELEGLEHALRALGRAQELSRRLLTFAQGGTPVTGAVSVPRLVRECAELTCHGSAVRCELELPDDLWPAEADEGQLSQVLNNLIFNALQAMPGGGVVTISAANRELGGDDGTGLPAGRYVHLRVTDRGAGIPPEALPRIFDPFFTTREGGSGLGLATAYSIVRQHRGAIRVDSTPGAGTAIELFLPASRRHPTPAGRPGPPGRAGSGRVLVMDDQDPVRGVLESMLRHLGYEPVGTRDGDEAVAAYRDALDRGEPFDVVILDLTVPGGKGGKQTLRDLLRLDPGVRAVASSGYADDPAVSGAGGNGFVAALPKPYSLARLSEVLGEVVGTGGG
jgi:PAS domain S-box-containing protein